MFDRYNILSLKDVQRTAKTMDKWFESRRAEARSQPHKPIQ